ncbi:hypothetical protein ACFWUW_22225 [Streptomyces sp. NPDC058655]|uniref:hypothetical protein n=1 Tax=Streptomyces sp. NPDC058655 TaxID=3346577 RepID=UPI0036631B19
MTAHEYGYQVLPGAALDTPGVEAVLRRRERGLRQGAALIAAEAVLLLAALLFGGPASLLGGVALAVLVPVMAVTAGVVLLWRRARRKERRVMAVYGWQVWPCRAEAVRVASADGERAQGRRWGTAGRIVLLRPDGRSHCSFPLPWDGWEGPKAPQRHVLDEVWFAGDTRFGGMLAVPGGLPFRYVRRSAPGLGQGAPAEDEAARRAAQR